MELFRVRVENVERWVAILNFEARKIVSKKFQKSHLSLHASHMLLNNFLNNFDDVLEIYVYPCEH